jgi:hypothetical protein
VTAPQHATPPHRMAPRDGLRMRHAAHTAPQLLPPAIAELVARDLTAWADFGYALNAGGLAWRVVADLEDLARQRQFAGTASETHQ